jgi:phospholipase/carboxylesterase
VRVQSDTEVVSLADWTLRIRRATQAPAHLLVLVHGWTGDENSMWVFVRNFPPNFWIIAPRAPYTAIPAGYSWRPLHPGIHDRPTFDNLRPAVDSLMDLVRAYAGANYLDATKFDAIGFSQGAAMVNSMALLRPERIRRAGVLAGFFPVGAESLISKKPLDGKSFFVAHGTLDEMVNIEIARRSVKLLEEAGASVTYCEDDVGHKLSAQCLRALLEFFT